MILLYLSIQPFPPPSSTDGRKGALVYNQTDNLLYYSTGDLGWSALGGSQGGGFQGAQGFQGAAGGIGAQGGQGSAGGAGAQGFQGASGFQGSAGGAGAQGFQGASGSQLIAGTTNQITSSTVGPTTTLSVPSLFIPPGDERVTGYLRVGDAAGAPINTTAGDITARRIVAGVDISFDETFPQVLLANDVYDEASSFPRYTSGTTLTINRSTDTGNTDLGTVMNRLAIANTNTAGMATRSNTVIQNEINGSGTITQLNTLLARNYIYPGYSGTIVSLRGIQIDPLSVISTNTGTIIDLRGLYVSSAIATNGITVTNSYGAYIGSGTATTINCGLQIIPRSGATNNYALWIPDQLGGTGGGITFGNTGDTSFWRGAANQLFTPGDWMSVHYLSSTIPTVSPGTGAGTAPTIAITGSDIAPIVTLTTGTGCAANATIFTITWGASWGASGPGVTWSGGNAATANLFNTANKTPFASTVNQSAMTFTSNTVALTDSTTYIFRFIASK